MKSIFLYYFFLLLLMGCGDNQGASNNASREPVIGTTVINYSVTQFFPHAADLFTEGLLVQDGQLFESTGSPYNLPKTQSVVGVIDLVTGKLDQKIVIDRTKYFGEGIVIVNHKLYQLTYTTQIGFIYDSHSFKRIGSFTYTNKQGWSLTTNGKEIIMSDGTSQLTMLDTATLKPSRTISVTEGGLPLVNLNELEFIKGFIYANIWQTNFIVKIDPSNGKVVGKLDLSSLVFEAKNKNPDADVLNGIAFDATADKIYITGKLWATIYQINFPH